MPTLAGTYIQKALDWLHEIQGTEVDYIFLIVFLFIVPRLLLRFNIPMALSAFCMGIFSSLSLGLYENDTVIPLFSFLGIVSLFLFAGLEVDIGSLKTNLAPVIEHLLLRVVILVLFTIGSVYTLKLSFAAAAILALAVVTPSTGFILDSLSTSKISDYNKYWVKVKAISSELVAIAALFILVQKGSVQSLIFSTITIVVLSAVLPFLFRTMAQTIEKYAPGSEFSFLLMLAVAFGIITKKLGAYYLVGAFLVGFVAGRFRKQSSSLTTEELVKSVRLFASFFMPFYFFRAGLDLAHDAISLASLKVAVALICIALPLRLFSIILHRKYSLKENWIDSITVSICLMPNLIFGLVLADILKEAFHVPPEIYGGLITYTIFITAIPPFLQRFVPELKDTEAQKLVKFSSYDDLMGFGQK